MSGSSWKRSGRLGLSTALAALAAALLVPPAQASPGDLDPSFGTGGKVATAFGAFGDVAHAVAIQADGRIVAAGSATLCCAAGDFELARYNADGSLDASFGTGGKVTTDFGFFDTAWAVAIQADGKIVAAGGGVGGDNDFKLARYNADGSLDASFGTGGKVTTDFGTFSFDVALTVAIQADGKVVAAGAGAQSSFALARYNADGSLDATFGTGGKVSTRLSFGGFGDVANAVAIQADSKIVAAGETNAGEFGLTRYNVDGSLDATFGTGGIVTTRFRGFFNRGRAVAIQADGKIVASGNDGIGCFALARYNSDGSLDPTFGVAGKVITAFGCGFGLRGAAAITIQRNGKIVAAGESGGATLDFGLARFSADGSLDATFGAGGTVTTDFGGGFFDPNDGAFAVAIQADGGIVAAGFGRDDCCGSRGDFALARYVGDPVDVTPPVITAPADIVADATGPDGAVVSYSASAVDDVDGPVPVICSPPSGSTFPIGTTTVDCTATDAAGNASNASFTVDVAGADEQVADLTALVDSYRLGKLGTSLHDKLVTVQRFLAARKPRQAEDNLAAFIAQLDAQRGKGLTQAQADALKTAALRILNVIES